MLLIDADKVVSADRLIEAMWDGEPPATARRQLHNAVAAIRRSFGSAKDVIAKDGPGYRIRIDPQDVDAHRFTTLVARAAEAADRAAAIEFLEAGLALWEGPALSGLNSRVLDIVAANLEEKRLCAIEQLFGLRLDGGDAAALVAPLGELASRNPLREETRRLLILALHHSGRKADALNVYEQGRRLLRDELGVAPGVRLRELYERILHDDIPQPKPEQEPVGNLQPAPVAVAEPCRSLLPYDTAHFTGRVDELRSLTTPRSVTGTALGIVAIDGMAGVGKTTLAVRLAHQLAHHYPEGHLFIDLHGRTPGQEPLDPDAALERLLLDIGLSPAQIPRDSRQRAARWRAEVAERRLLVVLDDALDVRQIRPLLPGTGKSLVIITSQPRLHGLDGVTSCSLDVFSAADAAELFTKIAGVDRTENRAAVAEIVALCGHLPLAISIAASRFRNRPVWTLDHLLVRLRHKYRQLAELSLGDRSVAAQLDMSHRDLPEEHSRLLCALGMVTQPGEEFDATTAAALLNLTIPMADRLLEELFDTHLLRQRTAGRYHFHNLVWAHAQSKVARDAVRELDVDDVLLDTFGHSTSAFCVRG